MIFYGRNVVLEALRSDSKVFKLYVEENINARDKIQEILDAAKSKNIPIFKSSRKQIDKLTKSHEHQGVAVDINFQMHKLADINDPKEFDSYIYISEATYEHNVGAIIRSAEAAGLSGVILPNDVKITPTIAKASTGALFFISIFSESIYTTVKSFKTKGFNIIGIERSGKYYYEENLTANNLFIIGGEDKSLSDGIRNKCDAILEIPQLGNVNSLNMSVAASIIFFERVKQIKQVNY